MEMGSRETPVFDPAYLERQYLNCLNVCGPKGAGKSAFLVALESHFGRGFKSVKDAPHNHDCDFPHMGEHPVISLDFSSFRAKNFEDALAYVAHQMSSLYLTHIDFANEYRGGYEFWERYLDVIEGMGSQDALQRSLQELVLVLGWPRGSFDCLRPIILIDEVSRPLLYAAKFDYLTKMRAFLNEFLKIDHYELTGGIITTSYTPANVAVSFSLPYIRDIPVNAIDPLVRHCGRIGIDLDLEPRQHTSWGYGRYFDTRMSFVDCFCKLMGESGQLDCGADGVEIALGADAVAFVGAKREWVDSERAAALRVQRERAENEEREYAAQLSDACRELIPSRYAGVRCLRMEATNTYAREALNELLRDLYALRETPDGSHDVYRFFQGLDEKLKNPGIDQVLCRLEADVPSGGARSRVSIDATDRYWGRFDCERENSHTPIDLALVKVYLCPCDDARVAELFNNVVRFMVEEGANRFHAKASRFKRNDQICLWVSREDFFALEQHVAELDIALRVSLPFVAYRGTMGISREFASWNSHNGAQATLIECYLESVSNANDIDVVDMYAQYVCAWNGGFTEDHLMSREFKYSNAQELLVLLETIGIVLGNAKPDDGCLLLNGDGSLWRALASAKNWYSLEKALTS